MTSHTPGPWTYVSCNADFSGGGQWFDIEAEGSNLLWYPYNAPPERERECEANARLIAAAPDMLDVLQRIHANGYAGMDDWHMVRDVIAQATGVIAND